MPQSDDMPPICDAVRQVVEDSGLSQRAFGDRLGEKQQTVSAWLKGRAPTLDDLARIEEAFSLQRGYLVRAAGYVADQTTTRAAIEGDTALVDRWRGVVLVVYDEAVAGTANERNSAPTASNTRAS